MSTNEHLFSHFQPITLAEMDAVRLMNRVDRKFVFHRSQLQDVLATLGNDYRALEIEGSRLSPYRTVYFDTAEFGMYRDHHNGKPNRTKVRYRHYLQSNAVFFEVKRKIRGLRTDKVRIPLIEMPSAVNGAETDLLNQFNINAQGLKPTVDVSYHRATLVRADGGERVTLDLGLTFSAQDQSANLANLVIAEVKTNALNGESPYVALMREMVIRPLSISKYATAVALLHPGAKVNAFKGKLKKVLEMNGSEQITQ